MNQRLFTKTRYSQACYEDIQKHPPLIFNLLAMSYFISLNWSEIGNQDWAWQTLKDEYQLQKLGSKQPEPQQHGDQFGI